MIVVNAFIEKSVNRNVCTAWHWIYWIKLFIAITVERKTLYSLLSIQKAYMSQLAWFGNRVFEIEVCWLPVPSPRGLWWASPPKKLKVPYNW